MIISIFVGFAILTSERYEKWSSLSGSIDPLWASTAKGAETNSKVRGLFLDQKKTTEEDVDLADFAPGFPLSQWVPSRINLSVVLCDANPWITAAGAPVDSVHRQCDVEIILRIRFQCSRRKEIQMIAPEVIKEINQLLQEGVLSQRKIARKLGVSRGTVHAVAKGKRRLSCRKKEEESPPFRPPTGPYTRCPLCGARVKMPCLACAMLISLPAMSLQNTSLRSFPVGTHGGGAGEESNWSWSKE